jgi:tetratricopeptide (TPR) repeat protein
VLRDSPDGDTVRAVTALAGTLNILGDRRGLEVADEGIELAEALGVDAAQLAHTFTIAGINYGMVSRIPLATAMLEYAARAAERGGDRYSQARALMNLADVIGGFDPAAAAAAARQALEIAQRLGASLMLSFAVMNLSDALVTSGEWDEASELLDDALGAGHVQEWVAIWQLGLLGLRGDSDEAVSRRSSVELRDKSEDPQDVAAIAWLDTIIAFGAGDLQGTIRHARRALAHAQVLGIRADVMRWTWGIGARAAHDLGDTAALRELVGLVDSHPVGHLTPIMRAEADVARIHLGMIDPEDVENVFQRAITTLRDLPAPYQLAWVLLDRGRDDDVAEAAAIAERLGAKPLAKRAAAARTVQPA